MIRHKSNDQTRVSTIKNRERLGDAVQKRYVLNDESIIEEDCRLTFKDIDVAVLLLPSDDEAIEFTRILESHNVRVLNRRTTKKSLPEAFCAATQCELFRGNLRRDTLRFIDLTCQVLVHHSPSL